MPYQWLRNRAWLLLDRLGYDVRRKATLPWGADAFRDQQRLLASAPVRVIVDAGANVGDTVAAYRGRFPDAVIHAFEPFEEVHRRLASRFAGDPKVRPHRTALSDASGTRRFFVNDADVTNSLLRLNPGAAAWAGAGAAAPGPGVEVATVSLDDFGAREDVTQIDLLKLDIQGGEGMALAGARRLLERQSIRLIYTEVLFAPIYAGQASFGDLAAVLADHGYQLFGLYNLAHGDRGLGWGDAIFRPGVSFSSR